MDRRQFLSSLLCLPFVGVAVRFWFSIWLNEGGEWRFWSERLCRLVGGCRPGGSWSEPYRGKDGEYEWHEFATCVRCGSYVHIKQHPMGFDLCDALAGTQLVYSAGRGHIDPPEPFDCHDFLASGCPQERTK